MSCNDIRLDHHLPFQLPVCAVYCILTMWKRYRASPWREGGPNMTGLPPNNRCIHRGAAAAAVGYASIYCWLYSIEKPWRNSFLKRDSLPLPFIQGVRYYTITMADIGFLFSFFLPSSSPSLLLQVVVVILILRYMNSTYCCLHIWKGNNIVEWLCSSTVVCSTTEGSLLPLVRVIEPDNPELIQKGLENV